MERKLTQGNTKQWNFLTARKVRGMAETVDSCMLKQTLTFRQAGKVMVRRLCTNGNLETKQNKWVIQVQDAEPVLVLDDKTVYFIRFVEKDGKETLRLTRPGQTKPDYSTNLYFQ
ncbi:hypothetical protein GCM10027190_01630 [Spirosoma areae]